MNVSSSLRTAFERHARHLCDVVGTTRTSSGHESPLAAVDDITLQLAAPGGDGRWTSVLATQLLAPLSDDVTRQPWLGAVVKARALLVHDTEGGTTLGAHRLLAAVLADWCGSVGVFQLLGDYQLVVAVEGRQLVNDGLWSILRQIAPDETANLGEDVVEDYITGARMLLLVFDWPAPEVFLDADDAALDDAGANDQTEPKSQLEKETLEYYVNDLPKAKFIFITPDWNVPDLLRGFVEDCSCFVLPVKVSCAVGTQATTKRSVDNSCHRVVRWAEHCPWKIKLLQCPGSRSYIVDFLEKYSSLRKCSSICELFWSIVQIQVKSFERKYRIISNVSSDLLLSLSFLAYEAECNGSVNAMNITHELWGQFLKVMLVSTESLVPDNENLSFHFIHNYHRYVLAGWHIFHQQEPLLPALKRTRSGDSVGAMVAGHLLRTILTNPHVLENNNTKSILKNLYLRSEYSLDPVTYLLSVISEFRCHDHLVTMLFRDAVFARQLELFDSAFLLEPLQCYLKWAEPNRVLLIVRPGEESYQIQSIIQHVSDLSISLGLGLMHHLDWRHRNDSDDILATALSATRARLQDFLGYLTFSGVKLLSPVSAPHLTCLRVRVNSEESLNELFKIQTVLHQLMWFEVDFDLPLTSIFKTHLPAITAPLCDVSFRDMSDSYVLPLLDFLSKIRKNHFSGLHLHESSLSASAVVHLLKELQKRGIKLSTPAEEVTRYRRWRFPELAVLNKDEICVEDKVRHLLGYDDRRQYSDNEVRSSHWATARELSSLDSALEAINTIVFFEYGCKNVLMTKNTNGTISKRVLILD